MPPNLKPLHYLRLKWALVPILFIKFQIITLKSAFFSVHQYLSLTNLLFERQQSILRNLTQLLSNSLCTLDVGSTPYRKRLQSQQENRHRPNNGHDVGYKLNGQTPY
jgi:hypothetical protein